MPPDLETIILRVAALRDRATGSQLARSMLDEIEDTLAEGYAEALAGDAWTMRTEQCLQELISNDRLPMRGRELRVLATEHAGFQRDLIRLRCQLAELRGDRDRLRGCSHARS